MRRDHAPTLGDILLTATIGVTVPTLVVLTWPGDPRRDLRAWMTAIVGSWGVGYVVGGWPRNRGG